MAGLCNWAAAMCTYHAVEKDVAPKIVNLRAAEAELKVAEKEKNTALAELATVQASLDDMQVGNPVSSYALGLCLRADVRCDLLCICFCGVPERSVYRRLFRTGLISRNQARLA